MAAGNANLLKRSLIDTDLIADMTLCIICSQRFDEHLHEPRSLYCGHTFCTACLGALVQKHKGKTGKSTILCPLDGEETLIKKGGDHTTLVTNQHVAKFAKAASIPLILRLIVRNMAGAPCGPALLLASGDSIRSIKLQLQEASHVYPARRQVLSMGVDDARVILEDTRTVGSYAIKSDSVLHVVILDRDEDEDDVRVRTVGYSARTDNQAGCVLLRPNDVSISPDGGTLCISSTQGHQVKLWRSDGSDHVLTIGTGVSGSGADQLNRPHGTCFSPDAARLVIADTNNDRVQVVQLPGGQHILTIGSTGSGVGEFHQPEAVCLTADGELMIVVDSGNHRVQILCAHCGVHVRTIGTGVEGGAADQFSYPGGASLSKDSTFLYVADRRNRRVQVIRVATGAQEFTIGSHGRDASQFEWPTRVCVSPSGNWLYVTDTYRCRIAVFYASTGAYAYVRAIETCCVRPDGSTGAGDHLVGLCIAPDGEHIFVADPLVDRVNVYRSA